MIKNETEYKAALEKLDTLVDECHFADDEDECIKEMETLITAVEDYEFEQKVLKTSASLARVLSRFI